MIRSAIVEDEKVYAEEIAGYCRRYSAEKKTEISSRWFDVLPPHTRDFSREII